MEQIRKIKFHKGVVNNFYSARHKLNLSNNINYFTGEIFFRHINKDLNYRLPDNIQILNFKDELTKGLTQVTGKAQVSIQQLLKKIIQDSGKVIPPAAFTFILESIGRFIIEKKLPQLTKELRKINKHAWTPHSIGALKERNYWKKDKLIKQELKFSERISHERDIVKDTPIILATSNEIISICGNYYNVPLKNILYFPPGSDEKIFKPREKKECMKAWNYLSKITGLKEQDLMNKRIIFETSRMDETKRKDLLINAFKMISEGPGSYDDVLLVIGGGPENEIFSGLKRLIKKNNLNKKAFVTGFIPDELIGEFFSIATIFASASEMEGFGISILNAISSKVPVVSSDLIPISVQYLRSSSFIVPAGDVKGFAESIKRYLNDEKLLLQYGEKGYKVSGDFKWDQLIKKMIKGLERLKVV